MVFSVFDCYTKQGQGEKVGGGGSYNKAENENLICGPYQDEMEALKSPESQVGERDKLILI